jgi:predicted ester cyclase
VADEENKQVYARYIELLNAQDFDVLHEVVDPERYREICVGFTQGWVALPEAVASLERVVGGIPDLHARIDDMVAEDDKVYARLTVTGRQDRRAHPAVRHVLPAQAAVRGGGEEGGGRPVGGRDGPPVLRGLRGRRRRNAGGRARDPG